MPRPHSRDGPEGPPPPIEGDISWTMTVCIVVLTITSLTTVALRFYTRGKLLGTLKSEDWTILVAMVGYYSDRRSLASIALGTVIRESGVRDHRANKALRGCLDVECRVRDILGAM